MQYFLTISLTLFTFYSYCQQIKLNGLASMHNSKYNTGKIQYVKDVYVIADYSKPAITDEYGKFGLEFVGVGYGTWVKVTAEKQGLELVNEYDLQHVMVGIKNVLPVYFAPRGELVKARMQLYNINKKIIDDNKNNYIARLWATEEESKIVIEELENKYGWIIGDRYEAERLLKEKAVELEKRLSELAVEMSTTNLDFASRNYIEAYEELKKGNLEKAIKIRDSIVQSYYIVNEALNVAEEIENIIKRDKASLISKIKQIINDWVNVIR